MGDTSHGRGLRPLLERWRGLLASRRHAPDATALLRDIDAYLRDMPLITSASAGPNVLMPLRLRLLGLDPAYLATTDRDAFHRLEAGCATCHHWRRCARELAAGDVQTGLDLYCNNALRFDALVLKRETDEPSHAA